MVNPINSQSTASQRRFLLRLLSSHRVLLSGLCLIQMLLLAIVATRFSPTPDEFPNLVAGTSYLRTGQFDMYNVNPPLVKLFSALPVALQGLELPTFAAGVRRPEFEFGRDFAMLHGGKAEQSLVLGRWISALFAVWGTVAIYYLGRVLQMERAGLIAAILWATSPLVLAYGPLVSFDIAAATALVHSLIALALWIRHPSLFSSLVCGIAVGFAISIKSSGVLLLAGFPLLWAILAIAQGLLRREEQRQRHHWLASTGTMIFQLAVFGLSAVLFVNVVYRFEGSFRSLESYRFVSHALSGMGESSEDYGGNRFAGTWLGELPVPFPKSFVVGIDSQKLDFENTHRPEYRYGKVHAGGEWNYYLVGYGTKLSILIILGWIVGACTLTMRPVAYVCLGIVPIALLLFVSSQTGMNSHFRYALMILGPLLLLAAHGWVAVAESIVTLSALRAVVLGGLIGWVVVSGLSNFPFTHSYANELAGGRFAAAERLGGSAGDWYQGWWVAREWMEKQLTDGRTVLVLDSHYNNSWNLHGRLLLVPVEKDDPSPPGDALLAIATTDRQSANIFRDQGWFLWLADSVEVYVLSPNQWDTIRSRFGPKLSWVHLAAE